MTELTIKGSEGTLVVGPAMFLMYLRKLCDVSVTNNTLSYLSSGYRENKILLIDFIEDLEEPEQFPKDVVYDDVVVRLSLPKRWNVFQLALAVSEKVEKFKQIKGDVVLDVWD